MTPYGKKLLLAKDAAEFKRLLEISSEGIWDEGQTRWQGNAIVTDDNGEKVLSLAGTNLQTAAPITFGGDPFEITFWLYMPSYNASNIFRAWGTTKSFGLARGQVSGVQDGISTPRIYYSSGTSSTTFSSSSPYWTFGANGRWTFFKFEYDGSSSLKIYQDDSLKKTVSTTLPREPRRLIFGGMTGYIDDFELVDNGVVKSKLNFGG